MPTTFNNLYEKLCRIENLLAAAHKAARGKREKGYVDRFRLELEKEVWRLHEELLNRTYRPGAYRSFWIYEPKPRLISAAPFRDRVVHHALCNVVEPLWERRFVSESFANRRGKGSSAARAHLARGIARYRYALHCDIRKFFPAMDHTVLKQLFRRVVAWRATGEQRATVVRGGSWNNNARNCRAANRNNTTPDNRNNNIGVRVVGVPSTFPGQSAASTDAARVPAERPAGCPGPGRNGQDRRSNWRGGTSSTQHAGERPAAATLYANS